MKMISRYSCLMLFPVLGFGFLSKPKVDHSIPSKRNSLDFIDKQHLFINKSQLLSRSISEIKAIRSNDCKRDDSAICFTKYVFENGNLRKEISFDEYKTNLNNAEELAYFYKYKKDKLGKNILLKRYGDAYNGSSEQDHINSYKYLNNKLYSETYKEGLLSYENTILKGKKEMVSYQMNTTYFYNDKGKLTRATTMINDNDNYNNTYYLYKEGVLLGYFPIKDVSYMSSKATDSIYYQKKIEELRKIGFESFRIKYFTKEVYKKILDDCYIPIKNNQLFVNGSPIKQFLSKMGKPDVKYIVFEISDNYFLFYKIID